VSSARTSTPACKSATGTPGSSNIGSSIAPFVPRPPSTTPHDFKIGRSLENLPRLIELGRDINRRLLELERSSCRPAPAASIFETLVMPSGEPGCRAPGLRFGDPRVVALCGALSQFRLVFAGFYAKELRPLVEHHLGRPYTMRQTAYDLRRLGRKGLLERLPGCNRYRLTALGRRLILFCARLYNHVFCPGLARLQPGYPAQQSSVCRPWRFVLVRGWHRIISCNYLWLSTQLSSIRFIVPSRDFLAAV
jgi:hypothetical protein